MGIWSFARAFSTQSWPSLLSFFLLKALRSFSYLAHVCVFCWRDKGAGFIRHLARSANLAFLGSCLCNPRAALLAFPLSPAVSLRTHTQLCISSSYPLLEMRNGMDAAAWLAKALGGLNAGFAAPQHRDIFMGPVSLEKEGSFKL